MFFFIASILSLDFLQVFLISAAANPKEERHRRKRGKRFSQTEVILWPLNRTKMKKKVLIFFNSWSLYQSKLSMDATLNQCSGGYPHLKLSSFNISRLTFLGFPQQVDIASKKFICLLCEVIYQFGGLELNQIQFSYLVDLILHFWRAWLVYSRVKLKPWKF